tara:strand:+ start:2529 stop:2717 length:189 start_codon:yes stop_codon:yes gene_type:complete
MTQEEIYSMLDNQISHLKMLRKAPCNSDVAFKTTSVELNIIAGRLRYLSDKLFDKTIVKDFE